MTKDNTPSGETVSDILSSHGGRTVTYYKRYVKAHYSFEHFLEDTKYADAVAEHSLRQAIEGMIERIIGEEADKHKPPFSQHDYGFMSANAVNDRVSKQRQRAKEEISKLFGKE